MQIYYTLLTNGDSMGFPLFGTKNYHYCVKGSVLGLTDCEVKSHWMYIARNRAVYMWYAGLLCHHSTVLHSYIVPSSLWPLIPTAGPCILLTFTKRKKWLCYLCKWLQSCVLTDSVSLISSLRGLVINWWNVDSVDVSPIPWTKLNATNTRKFNRNFHSSAPAWTSD